MNDHQSNLLPHKPRILILDDSKAFLSGLNSILINSGYDLVFYSSPILALSEIYFNIPDVIVCDLSMPEMNGFEFTKKLKEDPLLSFIPILIMTGQTDAEAMSDSILNGADAFCSKETIRFTLKPQLIALLRLKLTYEKVLQNKQIETNLKYQFIIDSLEIGIWKLNLKTQKIDWENSMFQLYELKKSDFNGYYTDWEYLLTPDSQEVFKKELNQVIRGEKEFNITFEIKTTNKKRKFIGGRGKLIRDEQQIPLFVYGINWNRTKEIELENSLFTERSIAFHKSKLASLGEMSASIAHEINNPLAIIEGSTRILLRFQEFPNQIKPYIEKIEKSTNRINKIVTGLRKYSRVSDNEKQTFQPHSIKLIINEALSLIDLNLKQNFIEIHVHCETESLIFCNEIEIEQVIINLINNSIDEIKNSDHRWINLSVTELDSEVVIEIKDSGIGITEEVAEKLFQPFFTTKAVGEGTGLGLSIVKGILDAHNALIQLKKNCPNTCFEIIFKKYREVKNAA